MEIVGVTCDGVGWRKKKGRSKAPRDRVQRQSSNAQWRVLEAFFLGRHVLAQLWLRFLLLLPPLVGQQACRGAERGGRVIVVCMERERERGREREVEREVERSRER